jgi:PRTRC genetic system protein E
MFQELMPLLSQRVLVLTLCRVTEEEVCLNVIPKPLKSDQRDEDAALTTPLAVTGTPKELDEQLPGQLMEFVETHLGLSSTLKSAKEQMEAAARAAREAARKSTATKSHASSGKSVTPGLTQAQTEAETNDKVGGSQSNPELAQTAASDVATTADLDATATGNLFDLAAKTGQQDE